MEVRKYLRVAEVESLASEWRAWARTDRARRAKYLWVFLTLYHTGARIREVLGLTDSAFDEKNSTITLSRLKQRGKNKGTVKVVPIHVAAMDEIINARILAKASGNVTPAYTTFYELFKMRAAAAGITSPRLQHPHVLRHSYAMYMLDSGLDVVSVRKMLGNSSIQSVLVYLDKSTEDIGEDMRKRGLLRAA